MIYVPQRLMLRRISRQKIYLGVIDKRISSELNTFYARTSIVEFCYTKKRGIQFFSTFY